MIVMRSDAATQSLNVRANVGELKLSVSVRTIVCDTGG